MNPFEDNLIYLINQKISNGLWMKHFLSLKIMQKTKKIRTLSWDLYSCCLATSTNPMQRHVWISNRIVNIITPK